MDKVAKAQYFAVAVENFLSNWNGEFPQFPLKVADLKEPQLVIGALFQVFDRLGIDRDFVFNPLLEEERDEHTPYYRDLLPIINMSRVVNHLVSVMPQADALSAISIAYFLQPTVATSHSILLLLFNLMIFNEGQLRDIAPYEEQIFQKGQQVHVLEEQKNKLQELLNEQAKEKGKRSERLEEIDRDTKQFKEELKEEKESHDSEKQDLEIVLKEKQDLQVSVEQKKAHRDALTTEIIRKRSLRVYDANDIRDQAEQATFHVQEAVDKVDALKQTLMQKETACNNLQNINPNLDAANNLLHEIAKLKGLECLETSPDKVGAELGMVEMELKDLSNRLAELQQARQDNLRVCTEHRAKRQEQQAIAISALEKAEQADRRCSEQNEKSILRIKSIQRATHEYEIEKQEGIKEIEKIKTQIHNELRSFSEALLVKAAQIEKNIQHKVKEA